VSVQAWLCIDTGNNDCDVLWICVNTGNNTVDMYQCR